MFADVIEIVARRCSDFKEIFNATGKRQKSGPRNNEIKSTYSFGGPSLESVGEVVSFIYSNYDTKLD